MRVTARRQIHYGRKHLAADRLVVLPQVLHAEGIVVCQVVGERMLRLPHRILRRLADGYLKVVPIH